MKKLLLVLFLSIVFIHDAIAQQWVYTGSMHTERRHHITHLLSTEEVLVAGGTDKIQNSLSSCELYNPTTGEWRVSTPMNVSRERHTVNSLPSGKLIVIGGNSGNTSSNLLTSTIEEYDPSTDTWTIKADLQIARQNHAAVRMNDNRILVIGGYTGSISSSCEIYDPMTETVITASPLNIARHEPHALLLPTGEVFIAGGRDGGSAGGYLRSCEIYNPVTDTWRIVENMAQPRSVGSLVIFGDGMILTTGGRKSQNDIAPGAEVFNYTTEEWNTIEPLHQARHWQGSVLLPHDRYLITGGYYDGDLNTNSVVDCTPLCEWYDKPTQTWYYAPSLNKQRGQHGAVFFRRLDGNLMIDNVIVTGGIVDDYDITNTCEILDVTEHWIEHYIAHQPQSDVVTTVPSEFDDRINILREGKDIVLASTFAHAEYQIFNTTGQACAKGELPSNALLNLSSFELPPGMYIIRLLADGEHITVKVIL